MKKAGVDTLTNEYIATHAGSLLLHERAEKLFPANGATHVIRILQPFGPYITHAKGAQMWDVDGNKYIDFIMGHGALLLGHCHHDVVRAVSEQMTKGVHYGENHELEIEWAELIKGIMPSMERIEFFACGQEANMMAIRIARIFTGRRKILRFVENFHGWFDEVSPVETPGIVAGEVKVIPLNDLNIVEKELTTREYAILMIEGGGAHMGGQIPWDINFVRALPALAKRNGTVCLLDEVVTGFRDAPGGYQSIVGLRPDLTSLGKAVGGGLGAGALIGRADILDILKPKVAPQPSIRHTGTWNGNPLTAAAGIAACKLYQDGKPQKQANEVGAYFAQKANEAVKERGLPVHFYGRSIIHTYIGPIDYASGDTLPPTKDEGKILAGLPAKQRLCLHLLQHGVATMAGRFFTMSAAHTKEDINQTVKALGDSLDAMVAEGSLK